MDDTAKKRRMVDMWICMKCNATIRSSKKPEFCRKCGSTKIRARKKGKR
jgi:ribosomal protein L40E